MGIRGECSSDGNNAKYSISYSVIQGIWPENTHPRNEVLVSVARCNCKSNFLSSIMTLPLFNDHCIVQTNCSVTQITNDREY